jgi:photosystem II stability/assembly factor-like uncharacterized protein
MPWNSCTGFDLRKKKEAQFSIMNIVYAVFRAGFMVLVCVSFVHAWRTEIMDSDADDRLRDIVQHSSGALVAVGDDGTIVRSEDEGRSWKKMDLPHIAGFGESGDISLRSIVELSHTHELIIVGAVYESHSPPMSPGVKGAPGSGGFHGNPSVEKWSVVLVSNDNGITWSKAAKIDGAALYWTKVISPVQCVFLGYADSLFAYSNKKVEAFGPNQLPSKFRKRTEPGVFNIPHDVEGRPPSFFGLSLPWGEQERVVKNFRDKVFALEKGKTIAVSLDNGLSWVPVTKGKDEMPEIRGFDVLNENVLVATCSDGILLFTADAGMTWEKRKLCDENLNDMFIRTPSDWWVAGDNGFVANTVDGGKSWTRIPVQTRKDLFKVFAQDDGENGWCFGKGGLLVHVYDERRVDPYLAERGTEDSSRIENDRKDHQKQTWEGRVIAEKSEWYAELHRGGVLSQGLALQTSPENVTVAIDGRSYSSNGRLRVCLPAGKHSIVVSKQDHFAKADSVDIELGKVEEKSVTLRRVQFQVSGSGCTGVFNSLSSLQRYGPFAGAGVMAGIVNVKKFISALSADAGVGNYGKYWYALGINEGYRFEAGRWMYATPFIGAAFRNSLEMEDSLHWDTVQSGNGVLPHYDTLDKAEKHEVADLGIQAGIDISIRKNNRWGFTVRPSVLVSSKALVTAAIRFGVVFWLL